MSAQPITLLTPEEYLERERTADFKSEYHQGATFAMSGAKRNHVMIAGNLAATIWIALRGHGCFTYQSDLKVLVEAVGLYTYPDVVVVCGEEELDDGQDVLLNPTLIAEVLSPPTEQYDRGKKFAFYRTIPTLQEYVLVAADRRRVEVFRRNEAGRFELYEATEGAVTLASVGCTVAMDEVYADVHFESAGKP